MNSYQKLQEKDQKNPGFVRWLGVSPQWKEWSQSPETDQNLLEAILDELDTSFVISSKDRARIPAEGKLLVLTNKPLGILDGISLGNAIMEIRPDVYWYGFPHLAELNGLRERTVEYLSGEQNREEMGVAEEILAKGSVLIMAPAKAPGRLTVKGTRERSWNPKKLDLIANQELPILPVFMVARNSARYYLLSAFRRHWAVGTLRRETSRFRGKEIEIRTGNPVPSRFLAGLKSKSAIRLLNKHLIQVGRGKKGVFRTEKTVIHPVPRRFIRNEILAGEQLGVTEDGKSIWLLTYDEARHTMREIARLREITFRKIGEGTGKKQDQDKYDKHYRHLVLWDDKEMEIVGAYRLGVVSDFWEDKGISGLYSSTLFEYEEEFIKLLPEAVECGRSFVQEKYWNSYALDYLWHGIGAYIAKHPEVKYLFGPVSVSQTYPEPARQMLVHFYRKWFPAGPKMGKARIPFATDPKREYELGDLFAADNYRDDFKTLKKALRNYGHSVPTLYKQYSELCVEGGVSFADFSIDPSFGNCLDGLILVRMNMLTEKKHKRYVASKMDQPVAGEQAKGEESAPRNDRATAGSGT